jgi:hypothetical protein
MREQPLSREELLALIPQLITARNQYVGTRGLLVPSSEPGQKPRGVDEIINDAKRIIMTVVQDLSRDDGPSEATPEILDIVP